MAASSQSAEPDEPQTNETSTPNSPQPDAVAASDSNMNIDPSLQASSESQPPAPLADNSSPDQANNSSPPAESQSVDEKIQHQPHPPPPPPHVPPHFQYPHPHVPHPLPIPHPHHPGFFFYPHPGPPGDGVHAPHPYYGPIPVHYDQEALRVAAAISNVNEHINVEPGSSVGHSVHQQTEPQHPVDHVVQTEPGQQPSNTPGQNDTPASRPKIHRVFMACVHCKRRKSKCDGERPTCTPCSRMSAVCEYAAERRMRGPNKNKRAPGEGRDARAVKKSKVHVTAEQEEEERRAEAEFAASQAQVHNPYILPEAFQHMVPPYDLSAIHPPPHGLAVGPPPHMLDPASYQAQAAAVQAQMIMNAQAQAQAQAQAAAAAAAAGNQDSIVYGPTPSSPSRPGPSHIISQGGPGFAASHIPPPPPPNVPLVLPCNRVPSHPYTLPAHILATPELFPSRESFRETVDSYLGSLSRKAADKALLPQLTYNAILALLLEHEVPTESAVAEPTVSTPLFKFWVRKSFHLGKVDGEDIVMHNGKPVAVREQLYNILVCCHAATRHGGRDKTCAMVNENYSWVPKAFVESFVKSCPGCPRRKKMEAATITEEAHRQGAALSKAAARSAPAPVQSRPDAEVNGDLDHQPMVLVDGPIIGAEGNQNFGNGTYPSQADSGEHHQTSDLPTSDRKPDPALGSATSPNGIDGNLKKRVQPKQRQLALKDKKTGTQNVEADDKLAEKALMALAAGAVNADGDEVMT